MTVEIKELKKIPDQQYADVITVENDASRIDTSLQALVISLALKAAREDHDNELKLQEK